MIKKRNRKGTGRKDKKRHRKSKEEDEIKSNQRPVGNPEIILIILIVLKAFSISDITTVISNMRTQLEKCLGYI